MIQLALDNGPFCEQSRWTGNTVRQRNKALLCQYWRDNYPRLVKLGSWLIPGGREAGEDLVSTALVKLLLVVETDERPLRHVAALFATVMRNLAIDQRRTARIATEVSDALALLAPIPGILPQGCRDPFDELATHEELAAIKRRVDSLPEDLRHLFAARLVEQRPYCDVARELQITEVLARKKVQKLRALIAPARAREGGGRPSHAPLPSVSPSNAA